MEKELKEYSNYLSDMIDYQMTFDKYEKLLKIEKELEIEKKISERDSKINELLNN